MTNGGRPIFQCALALISVWAAGSATQATAISRYATACEVPRSRLVPGTSTVRTSSSLTFDGLRRSWPFR